MSDDDSTKPLLERLCALQEEQLALTRQSLERHEERVQRQEKSQELWERQLASHDDHQKTYNERAERHEREARIRGIIMVVLWAVIAISVVVHFFF